MDVDEDFEVLVGLFWVCDCVSRRFIVFEYYDNNICLFFL